MPGSIHVTVLEAVELPAGHPESHEFVCVKVSLGEQECMTRPKRLHEGKTAPWNSDFSFPVLNLQNKLAVAICDSVGETVNCSDIEVRSILQKGYRDEFFDLEEGGRLHLKLSFILSDEERKQVEEMRAAAQRKKEQVAKEDMMRAYDFKRKEDFKAANGLQTIAESEVEHAGRSLDSWEVITKKKGKEVTSASLSTPLEPMESLDLKVQSTPVDTGSPTKLCEDKENCSINRCSSESSQHCDDVDFQAYLAIATPKKRMEPKLESSSSKSSKNRCGSVEKIETPPNSTRAGAYPRQSRLNQNRKVVAPKPTVDSNLRMKPKHDHPQPNNTSVGSHTQHLHVTENSKVACVVVPKSDEPKNNTPVPSVNSNPGIKSEHDHVSCPAPEMEECMEMRLKEVSDDLLPMTDSEEIAFFLESLMPKPFDPTVDEPQSLPKEFEFADKLLTSQENLASLKESGLPQEGVASNSMPTLSDEWQSIRKAPKLKEVGRRSPKKVSDAVKDILMEVSDRKEELRTLHLCPETGSKKPETNQQGVEQSFSTFPERSSSSRPRALVREDNSPSLLLKLLSDDGTSPRERVSNNLASMTSAPSEGWVCVERPPMIWNNVAKPREHISSVDQSVASSSSPPALQLHSVNTAGIPVNAQGGAKIPSHFSPLDEARRNTGNVKACINAFESSLHEGLDSVDKISPIAVGVDAKEKRGEEELRRWEEKLKSWEQPAEVKVIREESIHRNQDTGNLSWQADICTDSIKGEHESRLHRPSSERESSRLEFPAREERWNEGGAGQDEGDLKNTTTEEGLMDFLEYADTEALEKTLMLEVREPEQDVDFVVDQSSLSLPGKERETLDNQVENTVSEQKKEDNPSDLLKDTEERKAATEAPVSILNKTEHSVPLDGPGATDGCIESQDVAEVKFSKGSRTSSKLVPPAFGVKPWSFSGESLRGSKRYQFSIAKTRNSSISSCLNLGSTKIIKPEDRLTKTMDNPCKVAGQADNIIEDLCKSLEPQETVPGCIASHEKTSDSDNDELSSGKEKQTRSGLGGALKQVLSGAVILGGLFALWPRKTGHSERYHVVETGESLCSIVPGDCNNLSSPFCKLNPQVCHQKTVYPGQRLRLS